MFSRVTAFCALLAIGTYSLAQTETLPPGIQEVIRDLDGTATEAVKNPNDIGYTLAVVTRNGLAWTKSYGFADSGRTRPGADTEYAIGTGAFTAIMLLQLVRDGKAHLSDAAEKYVTELKSVRSQYPDAAPVTLHAVGAAHVRTEPGPHGPHLRYASLGRDARVAEDKFMVAPGHAG
jgi:CubicO group peptidase (beta-lactamase class C family)